MALLRALVFYKYEHMLMGALCTSALEEDENIWLDSFVKLRIWGHGRSSYLTSTDLIDTLLNDRFSLIIETKRERWKNPDAVSQRIVWKVNVIHNLCLP